MNNITTSVEVLSLNEIEMIHQSAVQVVENTGLKLPNKKCLLACQSLGALVDWDRQVFTVPNKVMEDLLNDLRHSMPTPSIKKILQPLKGYLSPQVFYVDYSEKTRRLGLLEDNLKGIAVLRNLEHIMGNGSIVVPSDVPSDMADVFAFQQMFKYSEEGGGTYVLSPASAKYILEFHKVMDRKTGYLFATVSPLQFSKEHVDIAMVFVENGLDLSIGPMVIGGTSAPVTIAGLVTLQTAEALASIFAVYAITGKFPAFNVAGHSMDLRSMICSFGSPNQALIGIATAQLARYYGYSDSWTNSGLTDSLVPDFQAGVEKALTASFSLLGGTKNMGCQGIVGADQGISLEQLVIDNEWIAAFNHIVKGFEVSEETIALDLIEQVGIGGNFVDQMHTVQNMRQSYWVSKIFSREAWDSWVAKDRKDTFDRAHEAVEAYIEKFYPYEPVISLDKARQIDEITAAAVQEFNAENAS